MKYLVVGLGNIGSEYQDTRHNIGFRVLDALVKASNLVFESKRYGAVAHYSLKGRQILLLEPNAYMNLSGKSVNYWAQAEKIPLSNILIVGDDLSLSFGVLRLKSKGSAGGHNGLKDIEAKLGTQEYARLRFGIGSDFSQGKQVDYVLGHFSEEELETMDDRINMAIEMIQSFVLSGIDITMNQFNKRK